MSSIFQTLRDDEKKVLMSGPSLVSILIAGADNNIDKDEKKGALAFVNSQASSSDTNIATLYKSVSKIFESQISALISELPKSAVDQQMVLRVRLTQLNHVLPKLPSEFSIAFHQTLQDLAKHVADASGGVFGFHTTSGKEEALLPLDMIDNPKNNEYSSSSYSSHPMR